MLPIEVRLRPVRNKELRAIGIASGICHRQNTRFIMLEGQGTPLIIKLVTRTSSTSPGGVAALDHKAVNDAVERGVIVEAVAGQKDEIIDSDGSLLSEQLHRDI